MKGNVNGQGMLRRGVRVGLLMAGVPGIPWAALAVGVAVAEFLRGGDTRIATRALQTGGMLIGGGLLAGVLMGLILGGGLAGASRLVTRTWGLALVGALLGALAFPAEVVVVTVGTDGGYAEIATTLLAWPVMAVVAAAHSADIVGRTRRRTWLWPPGPTRGRGRG